MKLETHFLSQPKMMEYRDYWEEIYLNYHLVLEIIYFSPPRRGA